MATGKYLKDMVKAVRIAKGLDGPVHVYNEDSVNVDDASFTERDIKAGAWFGNGVDEVYCVDDVDFDMENADITTYRKRGNDIKSEKGSDDFYELLELCFKQRFYSKNEALNWLRKTGEGN